jgi:iron(III) transport system substrate-binding protein
VHRVIAAVILLLALVASSCGGSDNGQENGDFETVFASLDGLSGQARERKLAALARAEGGELTLYTSMDTETVDAVAGAFEDEYDIEIAFYRAGGETVLPRLFEEAHAGYHGADVVRINGLAMTDLAHEDILVPYSSPYRRELIEGTAHDSWTTDAFGSFVLSRNTKLVQGSERPTSWEALANPRWKGRVAIEASDIDWYKELWEYWVEDEGKTAQQADRLFEAIARNARIVRGHSLLAQLMAAGEVVIAPNYQSTVDRFKDDGAPIAWRPAVDPIFSEGQGVGLVDGAPHPAGAVLFVDWLLTDGQNILVEHKSESARKDLLLAPNAKRRVIDFESLAAKQQRWTERFERLLALGEKIEEGK